jgi:hypothetical protein
MGQEFEKEAGFLPCGSVRGSHRKGDGLVKKKHTARKWRDFSGKRKA